MEELPYICDSHEYYLKDAYGFDEPALDLASDEEEENHDERLLLESDWVAELRAF